MTTSAAAPDPDEAWRLADKVADLAPAPERGYVQRQAQMIVGGILALSGSPDSARAVLMAARAGPDIDRDVLLPFYEAYMRVLLGDRDEAIDLLKGWLTAHPEQDHGLGGGDINWWWRDLQSHPRFGELLRGGAH